MAIFSDTRCRTLPISLRVQLTFITVAVTVALISALTYITAYHVRQHLVSEISNHQVTLVRKKALELDHQLMAAMAILHDASVQYPAGTDYLTAEQFLTEHQSLNNLFTAGIRLVDPRDVVVADFPNVVGLRGRKLTNTRYLHIILATKRPAISEPALGRMLNRPVVHVGVPLFSPDGSVRAVLVGTIDLTDSELSDLIPATTPSKPQQNFAVSFDALEEANAPGITQLRKLMPPDAVVQLLSRHQAAQEAPHVYQDQTGTEQLIATAYVPSANWLLLTAQPSNTLFNQAYVLQRNLIVAAAVFTALAAFTIVLAVNWAMRPLVSVSSQIASMSSHATPFATITSSHHHEIGQLVESFNHLAQGRMEYEQMLVTLNHSLADKSAQLSRLLANNESAREEERRHVAREVHDELGQSLTALSLNTALLETLLKTHQPELLHHIEAMREQVRSAMDSVRSVAISLHPPALNLGLERALEWLCDDFTDRTGIACFLETAALRCALDDRRVTSVFRIVQESLTNISRYANASQVTVTAQLQDEVIRLSVIDNGQGFDMREQALRLTFGLLGMRERAQSLGGQLDIVSAKGKGTQVHFTMPCNPAIGPAAA